MGRFEQFKDPLSHVEHMHIMWMIVLFNRTGIRVRELDQTSVLND